MGNTQFIRIDFVSFRGSVSDEISSITRIPITNPVDTSIIGWCFTHQSIQTKRNPSSATRNKSDLLCFVYSTRTTCLFVFLMMFWFNTYDVLLNSSLKSSHLSMVKQPLLNPNKPSLCFFIWGHFFTEFPTL